MNKGFIAIPIVIAVTIIVGIFVGAIYVDKVNESSEGLGVPSTNLTFQRSILPTDDKVYDLGTTTPAKEWKGIYTQDLFISGTCTGCGVGGAGENIFTLTDTTTVEATTTDVGIGLKLDIFTATSTTATSTFAGGFAVSTSGLVYDRSTGFVGIGTASPLFALDVRGSGTFLASFGTTNTFEIAPDFVGTGEINAGAFMQTGGGDMTFAADPTVGASTMIAYKEGSNWRSALEIAHTASGFGDLLLMKSGGNVGIGTTTPTGTLHVVTADAGNVTANSNSDDLVVENSSETGISILSPDANFSRLDFGSPADAVGAFMSWKNSTSLLSVGSSKVGATFVLYGDNTVTNLTLAGEIGSELATFAGLVDASHFVAISTTATSTFAGGLIVNSTDFVVDHDGGTVLFGALTPILDITKAQVYFAMDASKDIRIDGATNQRLVDSGTLHFDQIPAIPNTRTITAHVDANSQANTHVMVAELIATNIVSGEIISAFDVTIDTANSALGSFAHMFEGSCSGSGGIDCHMLHVNPNVDPLVQFSGGFIDMDSASTTAGGIVTSSFTDTASDVTVFASDNDVVDIGHATKFSVIDWTLDTVSSGAGIDPTFEYSTGVNTWTSFTPTDDTLGLRLNGVMFWDADALSGWMVGTGSEFIIRITRNRNSLATPPIEDFVQISVTTTYTWDEDGNLVFNNSTSTNATTTNIFISGQTRLASLSGFLKATAGVIATALINLASDITGILGVANGGTGASSLLDNAVLIGSGTSAITALTVGTDGQLLIGDSADDPVFATLNCDRSLTCTTGAGTLEIDIDSEIFTESASANLIATSSNQIATSTLPWLSKYFHQDATLTGIFCIGYDAGTSTIKVQIDGTDVLYGSGLQCGADLAISSTTLASTAITSGQRITVFVTDAEPTGSRPRLIEVTPVWTWND